MATTLASFTSIGFSNQLRILPKLCSPAVIDLSAQLAFGTTQMRYLGTSRRPERCSRDEYEAAVISLYVAGIVALAIEVAVICISLRGEGLFPSEGIEQEAIGVLFM